MNVVAPVHQNAKGITHPLFADRRPSQCAWPMWGDSTPLARKRCCGAPVRVGSKIPYCAAHLEAQRGNRETTA